ncbi:hypothetical protein RBXJA2T_05398 [Rubrivivax benzoatilyticus JA2 = ATCC BAA-35]|nr:hypothetical protein RBXJA2T_05398 [Rubrivivax benzoatilyticus JA2 = ATCC BAA-35]
MILSAATLPRLLAPLALAAGACLAGPAFADDLDALALEAEPEAPAAADAGSASKLFVEAAAGRADQRYGLGSRSIGRATLDWRDGRRWSPALQSVLSLRLDATRPSDERVSNPVLSLREAYVGWQADGARSALEFGRINLREGPGYGYNPSDFFRDQALRTITTVNPFTLRENRLGSVMLRGQHLWQDVALEAAFSPKLEDEASDHRFSADWGATNHRDRGQIVLGTRFSESWNARWLVHRADGESTRLGASTTALLSQALVGHAEWSWSRDRELLDQALGLDGGRRSHHRTALGLTYTTAGKLSLTGEFQYNGAALDRDGWKALAASPAAAAAYYGAATALQDNAARQAWLVYAVQRDLFIKNLELTGLLKLNRSDRSRMAWAELRYRMPRWDLALQLQDNHGDDWTEFGITTVKRSASLIGTVYF